MKAIRSNDRPLAYSLEGAALVTALPYADGDPLSANLKAARKLVKSAMETDPHPLMADLGEIEELETPALDRLSSFGEPVLGKRRVDVYDEAAIKVESLKQRVIQLSVIKRHINEIVKLRQATNSRLRDSLEKELRAVVEKCRTTNEQRKFSQVDPLHLG